MGQVLRRMREEEGGIEPNPKRNHIRGNETKNVPAQPRKSAKAGRGVLLAALVAWVGVKVEQARRPVAVDGNDHLARDLAAGDVRSPALLGAAGSFAAANAVIVVSV